MGIENGNSSVQQDVPATDKMFLQPTMTFDMK